MIFNDGSEQPAIAVITPFLRRTPVDVVGAAASLGIDVRTEHLPEDVSGKIERDRFKNTYTITVNAADPHVRRRFTIAHELAHYLLHRDLMGDGIVDDAMYRHSKIGDAFERQANRFAASLLMPDLEVKKAWDEGRRSAADLAAAFDVSPAVAEIRIRELRLG